MKTVRSRLKINNISYDKSIELATGSNGNTSRISRTLRIKRFEH